MKGTIVELQHIARPLSVSLISASTSFPRHNHLTVALNATKSPTPTGKEQHRMRKLDGTVEDFAAEQKPTCLSRLNESTLTHDQ